MMHKLIAPCYLHCLKIENLSVKKGDDVILHDVNLHVHCGTLTAVIGHNGAGKTTLIRAILGDIPCDGSIEFKSRHGGDALDLRIGYVPQKLSIDPDTPMSVLDMFISYGSKYPVFLPVLPKLKNRILEALNMLDAKELIDKPLGALSGGELQRVLLSLALLDEPNLLLLDEPVSGVDAGGVELFYSLINDLKRHHDLATILVSHDLDYVRRYADRVVLLDKTVIKDDTPGIVFDSPEFAAEFKGETIAR